MSTSILNIFLSKERHDKYRSYLCKDALSEYESIIVGGLDSYFSKHDEYSHDDFKKFFNHIYKPDINKEKRQILNEVIDSLTPDIDHSAEHLIKVYHRNYLNDTLIELASQGGSLNQVRSAIDEYESVCGLLEDHDKIVSTSNIHEILESISLGNGVKWRLPCLQDSIGNIGMGMFGVVAGRPDSGKTSFLCSELSFMAQQLKDDETILWLNNETRGHRIMSRLYCAGLGKSLEDIKANPDKAMDKFNQLGLNKIKIIDIHGKTTYNIEKLIREFNPKVLVIDMLDHVGGLVGKGNETVDARYGRLYQWALEISCKHCPVIATSQMNAPAEGIAYPNMAMLAGSGTAKQGAATFILMLGRSNDAGFENSRFLSTPKNKTGNPPLRQEVRFDRVTGRYLL